MWEGGDNFFVLYYGVHHRQEDERRHVRSLRHLSASELAASVLARASHQRWYNVEFGELPLPPEEADFELDRTTEIATLALETLGPSPDALCARL